MTQDASLRSENRWRKQIDGIEVHAGDNGHVAWMSDWDKAEEFVRRGIFRRHFGGPATYGLVYGHVSYYIA